MNKDELINGMSGILAAKWQEREGQVVPETKDVLLDGGAVNLDATFLYSDIVRSSMLVAHHPPSLVAKAFKCFLYCASRMVKSHGGAITSFDGDRIMGVFVGEKKNDNAVNCAFKINYVVEKIIRPNFLKQYKQFAAKPFTIRPFTIRHATGIDTSSAFVVRAGQRKDNDLVWLGRAPNFAAELSSIRRKFPSKSNVTYPCIFISKDVHADLSDIVKYEVNYKGKCKGTILHGRRKIPWRPRKYKWLGKSVLVFMSAHMREP